MQRYLIKNISIINEGEIRNSDILFDNERIEKIGIISEFKGAVSEIDGSGKYLIPGIIDDHVHFREPGYSEKGTIYTESKAAVAGGITSYMEMPNTQPPALTQGLLEDKYLLASKNSFANYSFYMGVSNDNLQEVLKTNLKINSVCGVKIFMGSSTGNMLVDNLLTIEEIFKNCELLIATHCEDECLINENLKRVKNRKEHSISIFDHPIIRNEEACYNSSFSAVQLAKKHGARLHILHISTEMELKLFSSILPLKDKRITSEVCVHHLYFTSEDYKVYGNLIKCNPSIKESFNKTALWKGVNDGSLDVIATDHAPHKWDEKQLPYLNAPSGIPLVQYALPMMLECYKNGLISLEMIVNKMCHGPAECFRIRERGFIREGYYGDCVIIDLDQGKQVKKEEILYKCGWSPFINHYFTSVITHTFINGHLVYGNGHWYESKKGARLLFSR